MTIADLMDAIEGFYELRQTQFNEFLVGVRIVSFYALIGNIDSKKAGIRNFEDLFAIEAVDKDIKKKRISRLKPTKIIVMPKEKDGKSVNG